MLVKKGAYEAAEALRKKWLATEARTHIPRAIHHVWIDLGKGPEPPEAYMASAERNAAIHPEFSVLIWNVGDLTTLVERHYGRAVNEAFASYKNGIYVIDAAKILILHRYGGYYADFDLVFYKNVEYILQSEDRYREGRVALKPAEIRDVFGAKTKRGFLVRLGSTGSFLNNFFMAFAPKHTFLSIGVVRLGSRPRGTFLNARNSVIGVMEIAGPMFVTRCYAEYCMRYAGAPNECLEITNRIKCVRESGLIAKSPLMDPFEAKASERVVESDDGAVAKHFSDATWLKHNMKHIYVDTLRVSLALVALVVVASIVGGIAFRVSDLTRPRREPLTYDE